MTGSTDERRSKRLFDVVASAVGLVVTSPVIAGLAIAVRATSPGPVFHTAQRIGRDGVPFTLYKFRSMRVGAAGQGPGITAKGDSRITKVGKLLRKTKLDELPQLWNVLRGDMSLVGPRPEDPRYVATYTDAQRRILAWRPGITSPASVSYRDEESILAAADDLEAAYAVVMDEKIRIDLEYFEHASLSGDLRWIVRTFTAILRS